MSKRNLLVLLGALLVLSTFSASGAPPSAVDGGGVPGEPSICGGGSWRLTLAGTSLETPTDEWVASVQIRGTVECPGDADAVCMGKGTLAEGVALAGCSDGGSGLLGPVTVCSPGPAYPGAIVHGEGHFTYRSMFASVDVDLDLTLAGNAPAEAINICV